jgi:hypothetical protein
MCRTEQGEDKMMNKRSAVVSLIALLCCLILASVALAQMFSDNYGVPWDARYGGGGLTSSDNYAINATVGQGAIGWTNSDNYGVCSGFWCEAGAEAGGRVYLPIILKDS